MMKYSRLILPQLILMGLGLAGFALVGRAIAVNRTPSLEPQQPAQPSLAQASAKQSLAQHLKQINAKMYGAYWCPACKKQIEVFGSQAFRQINYIECDPNGANAQPKVCTNAKIRAYPTWEINGKMYEGAYPLKALAQISGYRGPMNF